MSGATSRLRPPRQVFDSEGRPFLLTFSCDILSLLGRRLLRMWFCALYCAVFSPFGARALAVEFSLGDQVWNDTNGDGVCNNGEAGISGVVLNLCSDTNGNGTYDPGVDAFVASTTTDAGGTYAFAALAAGNYIVQVTPSNFVSGGPLYGSHASTGGGPVPDPNNAVDNDNNGYTMPGVGVVNKALALSADTTTLDFGFVQQPLAIAGVTPNAAGVPKYHRVELQVDLRNVAGTQYYEWDPQQGGVDLAATFVSPLGKAWTVAGFCDGAAWRVRFAPDTEGAWTFTVSARDASGTVVWNGPGNTFDCTASGDPGHLRIAGGYLRFREGQLFLGVGHNTGWQPEVEDPALSSMHDNGENLLAFWLAMPWAQPSWVSTVEPFWDRRAPIENSEQGVGNYNQAACAYLDGVVDRAEQNGIYLLPALWAHDQLTDDQPAGWPKAWSNNPYKTLCTATDFFKTSNAGADTPQWRYQKNFYRYLLARWGCSRAIAGWMAVAEIDGTTGYYYNKAQAETWCGAMRAYFAGADKFRSNASGQYPLVAMKTDDTSPDAATWDSGLDLRAVDSYLSSGDDIGVAGRLASQTATMRGSGKPSFHSECGGYTPDATEPLHLHNSIWAGIAAGACMTPLSWGDDQYYANPYPMLSPDMQAQLKYLAQFTRGLNYLGDAGLTAFSSGAGLTIGGTGGADCRGWGLRLADRGFVWVQRHVNGGVGIGGQTVQVAGLTNGWYAVEWYNVWGNGATPVAVSRVEVTNNTFSAAPAIPALSPLRADIAMKFTRAAIWQGGTAGALTAWNEPANWSSGAVPGTSDQAVIPAYPASGYCPEIGAAPLSAVDRLEVQGGATLTIGSGMTLQLLGAAAGPILTGNGTITGPGTLEIAAVADADRLLCQHTIAVSNLKLNSSYSARTYTVPAGVTVTAGTVSVASGILAVDGALHSSGATTIAAGMTLLGTGVAGNLVAGGTVSPGNGVGRLDAASADFSAGGALRIEIANDTAAGADTLVLSGALTMGGASTLALDMAGYTGVDRQFTVVESASWGTAEGFASVQVTGIARTVNVGYESDAVSGRKRVVAIIGDGGDGGSGGTSTALNVKRLSGTIVFGAGGRGTARVIGTMAGLPQNLAAAGMRVRVSAGGAVTEFALDRKGKGKLDKGRFKLGRPGKRGERTYRAALAGAFAATWSGAGFVEKDCRREQLTMAIEVDMGGALYSATVPVWYSARAGASGTFRK